MWDADLILCGVTDRFEVAIVIGACFLVNTVTDDSKTNWVEGLVMVSFYVMIVRRLPPVLLTLDGFTHFILSSRIYRPLHPGSTMENKKSKRCSCVRASLWL